MTWKQILARAILVFYLMAIVSIFGWIGHSWKGVLISNLALIGAVCLSIILHWSLENI